MKKLATVLVLIVSSICMFSGCSKAQKPPAENGTLPVAKKILVVYLSRTENTKAVAEMIHKNVGGTLVELELINPYPADYKTTVDQVARENDTGFLPPLKTKIDSIENYDVVFVGFPTWGMQLPPPVKSFLKQYDFRGKTIIPFNTNAGYGIGSSFQKLKELCPGSTILEGFSTQGGIERDGIKLVMKGEREKEVRSEIDKWLKKIGMIEGVN